MMQERVKGDAEELMMAVHVNDTARSVLTLEAGKLHFLLGI